MGGDLGWATSLGWVSEDVKKRLEAICECVWHYTAHYGGITRGKSLNFIIKESEGSYQPLYSCGNCHVQTAITRGKNRQSETALWLFFPNTETQRYPSHYNQINIFGSTKQQHSHTHVACRNKVLHPALWHNGGLMGVCFLITWGHTDTNHI